MPSARAAVLRRTGAPMTIETVAVGPLAADDVFVRVRAYLEGRLKLDEMISARIALAAINDGFAALKRGDTVRSVVMFA
jgi:Zn-dependent alcohol dehydrogenase